MGTKTIIIGGVVLLGLIAIGSQVSKKKEIAPETLTSQTNSEGSVIIVVTPQLSSDAFDFEIVLDTHSIDLSYDLTKLSVLKDDKGIEYKAISWIGDPPQGHHRKGTLEFPAIAPQPPFIELTIQSIGEIKKRNFRWNLYE